MAFPTDWGRRCALVIQADQVTDNEVNFPLLVTEDTLPSEIFDADGSYPALNGGGDIRFSSDEAGNTQLACEIESFITDNDPANGKAAIWVKVPSLSSSSNQTIYIWYSKAGESQPAEDNAYGKENVWDSGFVMVQHMNQTPTGSAGDIVDSTSNDNDGTTSGMDSADQVAGQIDGSLDFDGGTPDYVEVADSDSISITGTMTISAWINPTDFANYNGIVGKTNVNQGAPYDYYLVSSTGIPLFRRSVSSSANSAPQTGQMNYIAVSVDSGNTATHYLNGLSNGASNTGTRADAGKSLRIGSRDDLYTKFKGLIDEVRISNVARTAGWIATEYNNQYAPSTFLIEGTPETPGAAPITFIPQIIMF